MRNAGNARRVTRARGVIPGQPPGPAVVHCRYTQKAPSPMVADPMDLLVCAGQQVADERRGEAIHQRHQTVSALVVILVGDVPTALMIARVARAASAPSCPRRSSSRAPAPRPREPAVRGCIVTGGGSGPPHWRPCARYRRHRRGSAGSRGRPPGRWACAAERMPMRTVSAELKHLSLASSPAGVTQTVARLSYAPLARRASRS